MPSDTNRLAYNTNLVRPYDPDPLSDVGHRSNMIEQLSLAKQWLKQTTNDELSQYLHTLSEQIGISNKGEEASDIDAVLQQRLHTFGGNRRPATDPRFEMYEQLAAGGLRMVKLLLERKSVPGFEIDWQKVRDLLRFEAASWMLDQPDPALVDRGDVMIQNV